MLINSRVAASFVALTAAFVVLPAVSATAAGPARPAVRVGHVTGAADVNGSTTSVSVEFKVANRSTSSRAQRNARIFIADPTRPAGKDRGYQIGTTTVPALAAGAVRTVRGTGTVPAFATEGRYRVVVCIRAASRTYCARSHRAIVRVGAPVLTADPTQVTFADTEVGSSSASRSITITNTGRSRTGALSVASSGSDASSFSVVAGTCGPALSVGASCSAQVTFAPQGEAAVRAAVLKVGDGGHAALTVPLSGTGVAVAATAGIVPGSWNFGQVAVGGTSVSKTFEFHNYTDTDATLEDGSFGNPNNGFFFDYLDGQNTCLQGTIPAHGSCTFSVAFAPSSSGPFQETVTFSGAGIGAATSTLTGTGTASDTLMRPAAPRRSTNYLSGRVR